jgi:hypothetical protein
MTISSPTQLKKELQEQISVLEKKKQAALHSPSQRKNARHYENELRMLTAELVKIESQE